MAGDRKSTLEQTLEIEKLDQVRYSPTTLSERLKQRGKADDGTNG